jgi:heme-degrading monooxygenase HmoA
MFIAMNRFQVLCGQEETFEAVWLSRDTHLETVPGFLGFSLLRGPEREDHTLYASHSQWASKAAFEAWTKSEAFRLAHRQHAPLHGPPAIRGFRGAAGRRAGAIAASGDARLRTQQPQAGGWDLDPVGSPGAAEACVSRQNMMM